MFRTTLFDTPNPAHGLHLGQSPRQTFGKTCSFFHSLTHRCFSLSLSLTPDLRQHTDRTESLVATMVSLIPHSCGFGQQSGILLHPCHSFLHPSLEYSDAQVRGEEGYSNLPSLLRPAHRVHGAQPSSLVLLSLLATML